MRKLSILVALSACGGEDVVQPPTIDVASVHVTASRSRLAVGDTLRLAAVARDEGGAPVDGIAVSWSSSDTAVASVDATGLVGARAPGSARVSAAAGGRSGGVDLVVVAAGDPANRPPVARANGPYEGVTGSAVAVRRDGSADPDGAWTATWSFGDGSVEGPLDGAADPDPAHAYAQAGVYEVILTIVDAEGLAAAETTYAVIGHARGALPRYRMIAPGGVAYAINDADMVVGVRENRAFLWTAAEGLRELPSLPGGTQSAATDVNDHGEIVGSGTDAGGAWQAIRWTRDGRVEPLGSVQPGGAVAINDRGDVAWVSGAPAAGTVLLADGTAHDLGVRPDQRAEDPPAINDDGTIVRGPWLWTAANGWTRLADPPLAVGGTRANAINDRGDVAGETLYDFGDGSRFQRGSWWPAGGAPLDLGEDFVPLAIERGGAMAGFTGIGHKEPNQPMYRAADGRAVDLVTESGAPIAGRARNVNRHGHVVGSGDRLDEEVNDTGAIVWAAPHAP